MYKYEKIRLIGSGGEGKAHLVKKIDTGKLYVMKQRDFLLLEEASEGLNEAMSLAKIQSPNIVKFEEVFINQNNSLFSLCIVMEYCEGGDLMNNMIVRVSEIFKSSNENNNSKTNSLSSSNGGLNMSTLNVLKMYEEFFSRYLPSYTIGACESILTPESLNNSTNRNQSVLLSKSNRSSIDFSSSCRSSFDDTCIQQPSYSSVTKSRALSFCAKPISSSTPQLQHELLYPPATVQQNNISHQSNSKGVNVISNSSEMIYGVSPIKGVSIMAPCENVNFSSSPCSSGPTSPTFISQKDQINSCNNNKLKTSKSSFFNRNESVSILAYNYNPSQCPSPTLSSNNTSSAFYSSSSTKKQQDQNHHEKKKSWWKTFKAKERSQSTFNLFANALSITPSSFKSKRSSFNNQNQSPQVPQSPSTMFSNQQDNITNYNNNVCQIPNSNSSISLKIPRIPKRLLYSWIFQICLGVQSIHKSHLVHRDLKSENIFLTESQIIKIGDFGLATKYENHNIRGVAGTYYYNSPEIIQNEPYSRPADIFSLGCIFYEMCTLHLLPVTKRCIAEELIENRFDKKQFKEDFDEEDEQLADLVLCMLDIDPNRRPTIDSIILNRVFDKLKDPCSIVGISNGSNSSNLNSTNSSNGGKRESPLQRNKSIMQILSIQNENIISSASELNQQRQGITRRQLDKGDLIRAGEILAEAFSTDPRFQFVCGETSSKLEVKSKSTELGNELRKCFFEMCIRLMFQNKFMLWGVFNQENQLIGVACWSAPGKNGPPMVQLIIRVISMLPKFGFRVMRRIGKLMSSIESAMRNSETDIQNAPKDMYYLPYVGVTKDYRSQGVGEYLLKPVIEWAEHQNKKVKAISFTEKQINFFNKLGFAVTHTEPTTNLKGISSIYVLSKNP